MKISHANFESGNHTPKVVVIGGIAIPSTTIPITIILFAFDGTPVVPSPPKYAPSKGGYITCSQGINL
jgi:hypothetical protein